MASPDAIRAEVGNQLLLKLRHLTEAEWQAAERIAVAREHTHALAFRLTHDATMLMLEECGAETHALLLTQLADTNRLARVDGNQRDDSARDMRQRLARGVVAGAFLRETRGFNTGAFRELALPFAASIDFVKLDTIARAAHRLDAGDYSARGPAEWQAPTLQIHRQRSA